MPFAASTREVSVLPDLPDAELIDGANGFAVHERHFNDLLAQDLLTELVEESADNLPGGRVDDIAARSEERRVGKECRL